MSLNLVLDYESSALAAPQSFRTAMQAAANILDSSISDNITVTIQVGYGDWNNNQDTGIITGAEGGDSNGVEVSYTNLRAALASHENSAADQTFVNALPNTPALNGLSTFYVPSAVAKALGFLSPTSAAIDGAVGIGTRVPTNLLVGVALHELTHAMGREPGVGPFDLFRYTSPGNHLFSASDSAPPAYFSIDGGKTRLADFGQASDPSDFLDTGVQGATDPFNESYSSGTPPNLSVVDKELLDVLGFNTSGAVAVVSTPHLVDLSNDVLWFDSISGQTDIWNISNGQWYASFSAGSFPASGESVAGVGHFYGSGASDILWYNSSSGDVSEWKIAAGQRSASTDLGSHPGSGWQIAGTGDFNGDGTSDVLWFNSGSSQTDIWEISNGKWAGSVSPGTHPVGYQVAGVGDFTGAGTSDILWYDAATGDVDEWVINNGKWAASVDLGAHTGTGWQVAGVGDFTGNGTSDVLWFAPGTGQTDIWEVAGGKWIATGSPGTHPGTGWHVSDVADFNQDGISDILFQNSQTGATDLWKISNNHWAGSVDLGVHPGANWAIAGVGNFAHS